MHEIFLHHQAADKNDSINASSKPATTSMPTALHEPIAFSLMITPEQASLQLAALTVDIDRRPRIFPSQMSLASLVLLLIVVSC
jgi:hypothetical protein